MAEGLGPTILERRACRAARAAIVEILDARGPGSEGSAAEPAAPRALPTRVNRAVRHAAACAACRDLIEATILVDHRLRRYARAVRRAPVPDDRATLRRRARRRRGPAWRWKAGLVGLTAAVAIVGLLVGPDVVRRPRLATLQEAGVEAGEIAARRLVEERREALVLAGQLQLRSQPPPRRPPARRPVRPNPTTEADGTPTWPGPDGLGVGAPDRRPTESPGGSRTT
jgi:hypothetical protein